ncbi:MAG: dihydrofolate reductase [Phycisphaerales bacterium JB063]
MIYARSENHCIGKDGRIPWRLPDEFAHFKRTTMGRPIIMGRKTYEDHESALPGRLNIVVTSDPHYQAAKGVVITHTLDDAIARANAEHNDEGEVFVIGGVGLFEQVFNQAQRVYETVVHTILDGDTYLPTFDFTGWTAQTLHDHPADDRHPYAWTAKRYDRPNA